MSQYHGHTEWEKEFLKGFQSLCNTRNSWSVWEDFITLSACSIANSVDKREAVWRKREDLYLEIIKKYTKEEHDTLANLLAIIVSALDENPRQDFLGCLYMNLNLSSHWHGQFFTPWDISEVMTDMIIPDDFKEMVRENGYASVLDPACGGGCLLLAFANACKSKYDINYQRDVLFVAQDVDSIVGMMCYIQMSLLGCPGYVVIGDSLTEPVEGHILFPSAKDESNIWFTPFYFTEIWHNRRSVILLRNLLSVLSDAPEIKSDDTEPGTVLEPANKKPPVKKSKSLPAKPIKPVKTIFKKTPKYSIKDFFKKGVKK